VAAATCERASDRHGRLAVAAATNRLGLGDKISLIPGHCDPTSTSLRIRKPRGISRNGAPFAPARLRRRLRHPPEPGADFERKVPPERRRGRFFASRSAITASRAKSSLARSTTGTSIILPSTVTAPTPSASALS
jgi:hypothetical protein